jgi:hypothetical protein
MSEPQIRLLKPRVAQAFKRKNAAVLGDLTQHAAAMPVLHAVFVFALLVIVAHCRSSRIHGFSRLDKGVNAGYEESNRLKSCCHHM